MTKKDLGLLILIIVVGAIVAANNPRFLLPINIANTANLVGMFGISALGEAFVIITSGIELSVGSMIALIGGLFVCLPRYDTASLETLYRRLGTSARTQQRWVQSYGVQGPASAAVTLQNFSVYRCSVGSDQSGDFARCLCGGGR